jgi:hypothetical protein
LGKGDLGRLWRIDGEIDDLYSSGRNSPDGDGAGTAGRHFGRADPTGRASIGLESGVGRHGVSDNYTSRVLVANIGISKGIGQTLAYYRCLDTRIDIKFQIWGGKDRC